jgi:ring-1,2-phenylacetyl-CoA epoxidase subunit PaaB
MKSLDPRINRLSLQNNDGTLTAAEMWHTYEVFHQEKRGKHHIHVGSVHAPDPEMALVLAKEQYARRGRCVNLWVVKTSDIYAFQMEDEDMFATVAEKVHREPGIYSKVREKIEKFQKTQQSV